MSVTESISSYFDVEERGSDLRTELLAGVTTFLAMSYIIVVNPAILSEAITPANVGPGRVFQMLAVITILSSVVATLVMAFYADLPFALAPGMGLNAFFVVVVTVIDVSWQVALAAVFVEGIAFIALTAVGAREYVINLFPEPVKFGVGAGIGLFLALIGLQNMRIVANSLGSGVSLSPVLASDPVAILSIVGILITVGLYAAGVRGAIILGILLTSVGGYVAGALGATPYPLENLPEGQTFLDGGFVQLAPGVDQVAYGTAAYDITPLAGAFVQGLADVEAVTFAMVVFTFFFVDFFDTAGTLTGLGQAAGLLDDSGELPDMDRPLMADAVGTTVGAILGTSTVTAYIESSTGVEEGGRTGLTALVVATLFLVALAVVPLLNAIPSFAPYVAFIIVAIFMLQNITDIQWNRIDHAVPGGLTILVMPLANSIAAGIAAGLVSYPLVKAAQGDAREVHTGQWILAGFVVLYYFVRTNTLA
jgi:AGZA family xanthine/uracil permease-like MFS transporter